MEWNDFLDVIAAQVTNEHMYLCVILDDNDEGYQGVRSKEYFLAMSNRQHVKRLKREIARKIKSGGLYRYLPSSTLSSLLGYRDFGGAEGRRAWLMTLKNTEEVQDEN